MAEWRERTQPIKVGDTVAYSKAFLQSTGQQTGDTPHARGKVTAIINVSREVTLAEIEWNTPDLPTRVIVNNLTTARGITLGE